jgi:mono/diheme cytochrome c family protein
VAVVHDRDWEILGGYAKISDRTIHHIQGVCVTDPKHSASQPRKSLQPAGIAALIVGLIILLIWLGFAVTNWTAMARARKLQNPLPATPQALAEGKQLYRLHCQRCHGANGDGHGEKAPELSVAPGDFTDVAEMRRVSDGELYWQITAGRLPMPAFKKKVSEQGRWQLVDYIRTFSEKTPAGSPTSASPVNSDSGH